VDILKYIRALPEEEQAPYLRRETEKDVKDTLLELSAELNRREGLGGPRRWKVEKKDEGKVEEQDGEKNEEKHEEKNDQENE